MSFSSSLSKVRSWAMKSGVSLFWCWNIIFICATLPMLPALPLLIKEWLFDDVPFNYVFLLLAWMLVPWDARFWREPGCAIVPRRCLSSSSRWKGRFTASVFIA